MKNIRFQMMVVVLVVAMASFTSIASAQDGGTSVAGGFNSPQGILVAPDGNVWVIDSGVGGEQEIPMVNPETGEEIIATMGDTARVIEVAADGTQTVAATLPSIFTGDEAIGGARLALLDGTLYATSGGWQAEIGDEAGPNMAAVVKIADGQATEVASLWELEKEQNPDPNILDSHPYGITAGPDGWLWVADAGGNDLVKVDPSSGSTELVAVFDGLPGPFPNSARGGAMEMDPVPTAVAFDGEGNAYVSLLSGFPFPPGAAKVVKVSPDGGVSDYATGLTMLTDLRTGPDGELYAVQIAQFGEQGPAPNSGNLIRVKEGDASEVIVSGLSFPTSADFSEAGDAYVIINGAGAPGSGEVVKYAGATAIEGSPLPAAPPAAPAPPETVPQTGGAPLDLGLILAAAGALLLGSGLLLGRHRAAVRVRKD